MASSQNPTTSSGSFLELVEFALKGKTPSEVLNFRPSPEQQERISHLLRKERDGIISELERAELDTADQMEHLVIMMKKRAAAKLAE